MKSLDKINLDIQQEKERHTDAMKNVNSFEEITKEKKKFSVQIEFYNRAILSLEHFSEAYLRNEFDIVNKRKADFNNSRKIINKGVKNSDLKNASEYKEAVTAYLYYRRAAVSAKDNRRLRFLSYLLVN